MVTIVDDSHEVEHPIPSIGDAMGIAMLNYHENAQCSISESLVIFEGTELGYQFSLALVGSKSEVKPLADMIRSIVNGQAQA